MDLEIAVHYGVHIHSCSLVYTIVVAFLSVVLFTKLKFTFPDLSFESRTFVLLSVLSL